MKIYNSRMIQYHTCLTIVLLLFSILLSACGTKGTSISESGGDIYGDTQSFIAYLELPENLNIEKSIRVATVAMEPDASRIIVVNVRSDSKFIADDLRNINDSLSNTIMQYQPITTTSVDGYLNIHVVIRGYIIGLSNTAGAILASVAWVATDNRGNIVFQEEFFATKKNYLFGTIGYIKDSVHVAIVRRIATTSLMLADSQKNIPDSSQFESTYSSVDEAASYLPDKLISMGDPEMASLPGGFGLAAILTPTGLAVVEWESAKSSKQFDWEGYLSELARRQ